MFDTVEFTEENEITFTCWACKISCFGSQIFFDSKIHRDFNVICSTLYPRVPSFAGLAVDETYFQSKAEETSRILAIRFATNILCRISGALSQYKTVVLSDQKNTI